jgi:dienelactone hydrolase
VFAARLGIYGTSYGGATVVFVAAVDPRVKCVVSVGGSGQRGALDAQRTPPGLLINRCPDRIGVSRSNVHCPNRFADL